MAEQHEKALVPQIRFTGFTDPWEQRKVQDVADRFDNLRIPVAANLRVHGKTPYYGANGIQDYVDGFTHDGEFVLVAEDGANDLKNYPVKCVNGRIWVNNHAHVLQGKAGIADNSFLAFAISQSDIESLLVGGGRAKLNAETLMSIEFRLPCLQEQHQIGEYLTRLDHLITLHQRKYDKLCVLKKSMLDKMFPKGGSLYPEIRFAGFTDPWEQRKLGELCSFSKGCGYSKNDLRDQGTPIILYGRLYTNYETQIHSVDTFVKPLENSVYSEGGEVIIPASGETAEDISIASVVEKPGIILGGDLNVITSSADIDPVFLALELSYGKPHFDLAKRAQGKSVVHIHNEDIANVFFGHPNIAEQRRIGAFFDRLDSLITLHQRKLELLRNIKKSMLDKMFV